MLTRTFGSRMEFTMLQSRYLTKTLKSSFKTLTCILRRHGKTRSFPPFHAEKAFYLFFSYLLWSKPENNGVESYKFILVPLKLKYRHSFFNNTTHQTHFDFEMKKKNNYIYPLPPLQKKTKIPSSACY